MAVEVGRHSATIQDYGVTETSQKNPQLAVTFNVERQGTITWYGTLKEGRGQEITLESLVTMGLTKDDFTLEEFNKGVVSGLLNVKQAVTIVVDEETSMKDPTKSVKRVSWVNSLSAGSIKRTANTAAFGSQSFGGGVAAARAKTGVKKPEVVDDIPF